MSPEVVKKHYNEKSDIWSLGIIFMFMMINYRPYDGENIHKLMDNIKDLPINYHGIYIFLF